jgi:hypothetical protein
MLLRFYIVEQLRTAELMNKNCKSFQRRQQTLPEYHEDACVAE